MVRLLFLALIALGGWYAWRAFQRQTARVEAALRKAEVKRGDGQKPIALERDPKTGIYRPSDRQD
jgi:hypothetical protein